jgi:HD-like signal output (HDOD) protein
MSISQRPPTDGGVEQGTANAERGEKQKPGNPFQRSFPIHPSILSEASKLASRKTTKVDDLALCALQDPILVLELLKLANGTFFSAGRPPLTTASAAITRLGEDEMLNVLKSLMDRPIFTDPQVARIFEKHRSRSRRAGILARMLAETVAKSLSEECHTAGLCMFMGELLATAHLGETYVKLYESNNPATVLCRLAQDHRFDVEAMGLSYLQKSGIPASLLFAISREGKPNTPDRAPMKPICFAATEMVDAFDLNKWEKLAPGKQLAPKSALRFLRLSDTQYMRLYERASEYLFQDKLIQERISVEDLGRSSSTGRDEDFDFVIQTADSDVPAAAGSSLENDLLSLLDPAENIEEAPNTAPEAGGTINAKTLSDSYNIRRDAPAKSVARNENPLPLVAPPPLRTSAGNAFVSNVTEQLDKATTSEELLRSILAILTDSGPFEKSALIVVSKDRKNAIVVAARGPSITCGQTLTLSDPLSPLAQCFSKVQSFGNKGSQESPWGSKAFALSPVDADHETPVALYADCGNEGSLTFEARRIFRAVVDILNQKLPTIPGGIPVEV